MGVPQVFFLSCDPRPKPSTLADSTCVAAPPSLSQACAGLLGGLDRSLRQFPTDGFLAADGVTYGDLCLFDALETLQEYRPSALDPYAAQ